MANAIFLSWDRPAPGREAQAVEHFGEFISMLSDEVSRGTIDGFEPCMLDAYEGEMNGFVLIKGDHRGIARLLESDGWLDHVARGRVNMQRLSVMTASTGDVMQDRMSRYLKYA